MSAIESGRLTEVVRRLFEIEGMQVTIQPTDGPGDLVVESSQGQRALVEVKYFRSPTFPGKLLNSAIHQLQHALAKSSAKVGILATNATITDLAKRQIELPTYIRLYDLPTLQNLAVKDQSIAEELNQIQMLGSSPPKEEISIDAELTLQDDFLRLWSYAPDVINTSDIAPPETKGNELAERIRSIETGRSGAKAFEDACTDALKYIFSDHLIQWKRENTTDSGIHRFDLIARSNSDADFWVSLAGDFRSRYIVFEFKNYSDVISQKEVYSAEKYLFPAAMRGAAIVIARKGSHDNAKSVARGALREAGKLIMLLDLDDLFKMLDAQDAGDDASLVLLDRLDEMLMAIER